MDRITWPDGKDFAFTVFDDTDFATVENVGSVYAFLRDQGLRTTKSIWPVQGNYAMVNGEEQGSTCDDQEYLAWVQELQRDGFEIGYHNTTFHSSTREQIIKGTDKFAEMFAHYPTSLAQHQADEAIYWGDRRISGVNALIYNLLTMYKQRGISKGHIESSEYFWGDICKNRFKYVRNFVFPDINTLEACPEMPYHDRKRPDVNYWFASSEGPIAASFNSCISEPAQDRLEADGGACIMYTHFAKGFFDGRELDRRFIALTKRLSRKNGWFVPVSTLLDYLLEIKGHHDIKNSERGRLERKWLLHKIRVGTT